MHDLIHEIGAGPSFLYLVSVLFLLGLVFGPLEILFPANNQRLFRYRGITLDVFYWFFTPIFTRMTTNYALAGILFVLYYFLGSAFQVSILDGYGPLSRQPKLLQALEILLLVDFIDYWTHRAFHTSRLWRIHAIHHSPEQMNWISSSRMHPLNDLVTRVCQVIPVAMLGFSGSAVLFVVPYLFFYVIFLHSNLSWNFGPLRTVLVSPAYHRWHHTTEDEGIDKNFAGIFPIWDILFGTYHCPDHLPKKYGVLKEKIPESILGQLIYPFRPPKAEAKPADSQRLV